MTCLTVMKHLSLVQPLNVCNNMCTPINSTCTIWFLVMQISRYMMNLLIPDPSLIFGGVVVKIKLQRRYQEYFLNCHQAERLSWSFAQNLPMANPVVPSQQVNSHCSLRRNPIGPCWCLWRPSIFVAFSSLYLF